MKDIPVFHTEYGVASLFLREIPYRKRAHIKIQSSLEPDKLLEECIGFCRACGAEWIDAAGDPFLEKNLSNIYSNLKCAYPSAE